jgi:hypothetical protein
VGDVDSLKALPNKRGIRLNFLSNVGFLELHFPLYPKDPSLGSIFNLFEVKYLPFDKRNE